MLSLQMIACYENKLFFNHFNLYKNIMLPENEFIVIDNGLIRCRDEMFSNNCYIGGIIVG